MFDIGFTEVLVIAVISLIVIGPDRLPETVRTVSMWIGRFKRSLRETRREIEQQLGTDEIRRQLHNEEIMRNLEKMRGEMDALKKEVRLESELFEDSPNTSPTSAETHGAADDAQENPNAEAGDDGSAADLRPSEQKHSEGSSD